MNKIALAAQIGNPRFDIHIDGLRLAEHFVGRLGSHPDHVIPLGWSAADSTKEQQTLIQMLGRAPSELSSGRIAVLVCKECGDLACGALTVRITRSDHAVTWTDWAYENGYQPAEALSWPTYPESFVFDLEQYEEAFSNVGSLA